MPKSKNSNDNSTIIASSKQVAAFFEVTQSALRNWKGRGCPNAGHNHWDLKAVNAWFIDNIFESRMETSDPELAASKRKYWASKAQRESLRAAEEERSLISVPEILELYGSLMGRFKNGLLNFSSRLPPVLSGKSQVEMIGNVKSECCLLLSGFVGSKIYGEHKVPREYLDLFAPNWEAKHTKGKKK